MDTISVNQLRRFSTALSAFITHYDELRSHLSFINSSIDSKLPNHLVQTTNLNLSAIKKVCLLETFCDQTIIDLPEVIVSEQNPKESVSDCQRSHEETEIVHVSKNREEIDASENSVETDTCRKHEETVLETSCYQTTTAVLEAVVSEQNPNRMAANVCNKPELADILITPEQTDILNKTEQIDICNNPEEIDKLKKFEENELNYIVATGALEKHEETVSETFCDDQTKTAVVSEQNPNGMVANCEQSHENARTPESLKEIDVWKNPAVINVSRKPEQTDITSNAQEIDILKKPEQTDVCKDPEENYTPMTIEETDTLKKHKKTGICKKVKGTGTIKNFVGKLQYLCQNMHSKGMLRHVTTHSKTVNLRGEIAKALKLAKDPAKLVLSSVSKFFVEDSSAFCKDSGLHLDKQNAERLASVLILECFMMISSDGGIEISIRHRKCAEKYAVSWRKRMIREGGFGQTDEVDAKGLLLLISGFGVRDIFKIKHILDLIRASNMKGISTALCHTVFLIPKIPDVVNLMVKNNLEIEAVDVAYTFGLEDMCNPRNILTTYLHKKVKDVQNGSPFQMLDAVKQQLYDLKSTIQCLESHNVDPYVLLPDIKINETIQNLEKVVNEWKLIPKRKSLENLSHQEAKRACFSHEDMRPQQKPVDHYGMYRFNQSTQPSIGYYDQALRTAKEFDVSKNPEEIDALKKHAETDSSKKAKETVPESSCDQTTPVVPEAIVSEQKPNGLAANCDQSHEDVTTPESLEEINVSNNHGEIDILKKHEQADICKNPEETAILKKHGEIDTSMIPEEIDTSKSREEIDISMIPEEVKTLKKPEETFSETSCDRTTPTVLEAIDSEQNPKGMTIDGQQSRENVTSPESLEEINVSNKPEKLNILKKREQADICKNPEETIVLKKPRKKEAKAFQSVKNPEESVVLNETSNKSVVSVLQSLCQSMSFKLLKRHVTTHLSEMINLREEIAKALKLAKNPAKLVLSSIGRFYVTGSRTFSKPHQHKENLRRLAAVLILECFVMISSDGITIKKSEQDCAADAAVEWRKRMIKEGGFGHTDEVDARGLLLLISGFGIQDHVFTIQDVMDLIRASNVKGISTALCRSVHLIPIIPWVINLMVKNNLEIEAVDLAYTFGLEAMCHPQDILTTYLNHKIEDFQNNLSSQMSEAVEQPLSDLKSIKQCSESRNVDPSTLSGFKINENIHNLEKQVIEWKLIQKKTDTSKKPEETVPEISCDQMITAVSEAIVSEQNPDRMASNREQSYENVETPESLDEIDVSKKPEQTDICKNTEVTVSLKKPEEVDTLMLPEEIDTSKKPEETVPESSCDQTTLAVPEAMVTEQNPNRTAANREQSHENVSKKSTVIDISKKVEQTDILKKPEQTGICKNLEETIVLKKPEKTGTLKKQEETEALKKSVISALESLCQSMSSNKMKWHVAAHFSELINHREEIAKALKLAKDPAKLVLNSVGAFYVQDSRTFCQNKQNLEHLYRKAVVLILECFVMINSDGIEIAKSDQESAAEAAVSWRKRMIREGGFGHTDEVDARGLLLLISGFGIQDHVFKVQDIMDLIRASNVKEISTALRRSVFLVPKIPEVIDLMVMNNLEIEAADIAYTFGLEDKCHPLNILATFLHKHMRNIPDGSFFQMLEEMKQQLLDLKAVKQCLESHNIDPSMHLPDFKINGKIQNLEKELNEAKLIQKRKSLDTPIHQEAKRACFGHENMPRHHSPVDHRCYRSTQPTIGHFDSDRDLHNSYVSNYSPSYVYNTPAMPENITNGPVAGFHGSYDQMVHTGNVEPYGWHEPYVQRYLRHDQTYDSQPYGRGRPWGWGEPEPFPPFHPSGGFQGRRGPSSDLYGFADIAERESRGFMHRW